MICIYGSKTHAIWQRWKRLVQSRLFAILSPVYRGSTNKKAPMATKELRELRHRYKAAYTNYLHCVHEISDATQAGTWPDPEVLEREDQGYNEISFLRKALLDALRAHVMKTEIQGQASVQRAEDLISS